MYTWFPIAIASKGVGAKGSALGAQSIIYLQTGS
jgi:hypothetical protein